MPRIPGEVWDPKKKMMVIPKKKQKSEGFLNVGPIRRNARMVPPSEKQKSQLMASGSKSMKQQAKAIVPDELNDQEMENQKKARLKYLAKK